MTEASKMKAQTKTEEIEVRSLSTMVLLVARWWRSRVGDASMYGAVCMYALDAASESCETYMRRKPGKR